MLATTLEDNRGQVPREEAEVGSAANSYEILAKLATGGMAEIFLAKGVGSAGVERYVVLKRILRHRADDQVFVRMFLDEARLAAQLQHPNIAQVYDIGKLGDSYFFTMEYVHGETVRALLQRSHALRSPIPIQTVLVIAAGSAAGLHHAHERHGFDGRPLGIVHRDVSPSNLMVSYEGGVKVVDFGVAKAAHRSQETRSGTVKGKIAYLSPEQCRGNIVDRRSDLFSLGIVLWEMLTTERLYKRGTDFETMAAIVSEDVPPPSRRRAGVPPELDEIVLRLLAKDPAMRFQTADEAHEAIENSAVRIGSALSGASVARFLRDLFGQRPEPWIEMQSRETHPEAFTVTSEPIPVDLGLQPADELQRKLGAVPDFSAPEANDDLPPPRAPSEGLSTVPFRMDAATTTPFGLAETEPPRPQLTAVPTTNMRVAPGPATLPYAAPVMAPMVGTESSANHLAPSASYPSIANYPAYAVQPAEPPPTPPRRMSRVLIFLLSAFAIGIGLGVAFAVQHGRSAAPAIVVVTADAGAPSPPKLEVAEVVPTAAADAAAAVPPPPTPAAVPPPPTPADAAVPEVVVDTAVAQATIDAGVPRKPPRPPVRHDDPSPASELAREIAATQYPEAVATCTGNPSLTATMAASCIVAACHTHDTAKAKKWLANLPASKRAAFANACKAEGTPLETDKPGGPDRPDKPDRPVKPKDDCVADPMACQH